MALSVTNGFAFSGGSSVARGRGQPVVSDSGRLLENLGSAPGVGRRERGLRDARLFRLRERRGKFCAQRQRDRHRAGRLHGRPGLHVNARDAEHPAQPSVVHRDVRAGNVEGIGSPDAQSGYPVGACTSGPGRRTARFRISPPTTSTRASRPRSFSTRRRACLTLATRSSPRATRG